MPPSPPNTVPLIAIATFRRPQLLHALLDSLERAGARGAEVIVVDNDPSGTARAVAESSAVVTRYLIEPEAGIAQARNRALDEFSERHHTILFVDDDETVDDRWLSTMISYLDASGAEVALGAVHTIIPDNAPVWLSRGGFLHRGIPATGTECHGAATNNSALRRTAWLAAGSPRFNVAYSSTGGSDTEFFQRIIEAGFPVHFVAEAVVIERLPADRLSRRWVARRLVRNGIVLGRIHAERRGRRAALLEGIRRAGEGSRLAWRDITSFGHVRSRAASETLLGIGRVYSAFGGRIHEYRRR